MHDNNLAGRPAAPLPHLPVLANDDAARALAQLWYSEHQAEHLTHDSDMLVKRCAAFLQGEGVAAARAHRLALHALGERHTSSCGAFIDIDHSTSHLVFVVDPETNREFAFTAADLTRFARCSIDNAPIARAAFDTFPARTPR